MPVGLSLLETVEQCLQAEGLFPTDLSLVHRIINFEMGDFTLRWPTDLEGGPEFHLKITQQLSQLSVGKPMVVWSVELEGVGDKAGRTLLESTVSSRSLAREVARGCASLFNAHPSIAAGDSDVNDA